MIWRLDVVHKDGRKQTYPMFGLHSEVKKYIDDRYDRGDIATIEAFVEKPVESLFRGHTAEFEEKEWQDKLNFGIIRNWKTFWWWLSK